MSATTIKLKDALASELADIMMAALREQAGMCVKDAETFYKRKGELMQIIEGWILA